jgi:hypothetical protein
MAVPHTRSAVAAAVLTLACAIATPAESWRVRPVRCVSCLDARYDPPRQVRMQVRMQLSDVKCRKQVQGQAGMPQVALHPRGDAQDVQGVGASGRVESSESSTCLLGFAEEVPRRLLIHDPASLALRACPRGLWAGSSCGRMAASGCHRWPGPASPNAKPRSCRPSASVCVTARSPTACTSRCGRSRATSVPCCASSASATGRPWWRWTRRSAGPRRSVLPCPSR